MHSERCYESKYLDVIFDDLTPELEIKLLDDGWDICTFEQDRNGNDIAVFTKARE